MTMKKRTFQILSLALVCLLVFSLCSCGKEENSNKAETENGKLVWYLGGNNIFAGDVDVKELFEGYEDTIDPEKIYSSLELTEEMIHGVYTLNNKEKDIKTVRKEIPFEDVAFDNVTANISILPVAVYLGSDNICSSETGYNYGEFENITDKEVAVLEFATKDSTGQTPCIYEINGNKITFTSIDQTSGEDEPFAYKLSDAVFTYDFELRGPYMTLSKGGHSLKLKAYCLTENTKDTLSMNGYSLPNSPLIGDLDYFASANAWNYAVKRDGSYVDLSAYKIDDTGRFTVYLSERDMVSGETEKFVNQYAYIIQSAASVYGNDFGVILFDGNKAYYYTDDITDREARSLAEQGANVNDLTEEEIKEIAEKKSDLFDDLYKEFEAQGIDVTINRSNGEIAMDSSVLFGGDSAVITADGKSLINKFLKAYTSIIYNEKYDGFISKTMVEGHTAPVAGSTYENSLSLSQERAENVKDYCLSADTGIDNSKLASTLEATGLSNSKPVYNSDGEIDMAACRRVSFRFIVNIDKQG